MTTLEKAAENAAEEIRGWASGYISDTKSTEIILRHLEPVKKELDEARELIKPLMESVSPDFKTEWDIQAQRWLERNEGGK